ncbi:alpha-1,3-mannosyltransferase ALG2 [Vararia minispora EC-137]|uniref:Alpha-1,3-mannosyltransferase ALG2 n=1 Tax=Vararia minispora EC-137 TaxID=1314806 RepID=A0ACB8QTH6_9AGAM|nr:alpha-1,3-mannosyltransferase ALG2 [Vararia minispora EC-137]
MSRSNSLRIAFIHPDLGIGGAERLVVDAALGLQRLGHYIEIFTSHHDPKHCFDETRDGTLHVHGIHPPLPRAIAGKFHILFAHLRQLHLISYLLRPGGPDFDVYFVDQLSICIPLLRLLGGRRVVFYCHFPDKLLANGEYVEGKMLRQGGLLKRAYRVPMDWLEEVTTRNADIILANSRFTSSVFRAYFSSIPQDPRVVYPGVNLSAYEPLPVTALQDPDVAGVLSSRPTLLSMNRFEKKKNALLAIDAFALLRKSLALTSDADRSADARLILAGGYDPRVEENTRTLAGLVERAKDRSLTYIITKPAASPVALPAFTAPVGAPDIVFLLNFSTAQRAALLNAPSTRVLLYTPANEHFGIGPVEGMACGVPVLACNSGGPTESLLDGTTGWLRTPEPAVWADALADCLRMDESARGSMATAGRRRARELFGMDAMATQLEREVRAADALGPIPTGWRWRVSAVLVSTFAGFMSSIFSEIGDTSYAVILFFALASSRMWGFGAYADARAAGPVPENWRRPGSKWEMLSCAMSLVFGGLFANVFLTSGRRQYGPPPLAKLRWG